MMPPKFIMTAMSYILSWIKKNGYVLVFSLLTLLTYIALFVSRSLDDNRLTNWQWAFNGVDALEVFFILIFGLVSVYVLSRISFLDKYPVAVLFFFPFLITSLIWREPEVIVDASRYFTQAKHLEVYGIRYFIEEWGRGINIWTDLPLIPFLYGLIFKFFGESRIYVQIFTTFLFSMTVVLTYMIGRMLWDKEIGFYAGVLLLGMPYLLTQVPLMLVDVPTMFFFVLSIFTFIKALNRGGMWIGFSSVAIFLAFFSKYSTWPMMSVLIVIFLVYLSTSGVQHSAFSVQQNTTDSNPPQMYRTPNYFYRGLMTFFITAIMIGIVFWYKSDVIYEQIQLLISYQKPGLERWSESYISTFFFQIHPFITAAALYSIYIAFKKRDLKYIIIIWLALLIILLQIKRIRYIIMTFPMFSLMASYGLAQIGDRERIKFISMCSVIFSIVIVLFVYLPFMAKISTVNLKAAGKYLDMIEESNVEVFTLTPEKPVANPDVAVPILDLFTKKRIHYNPFALPDKSPHPPLTKRGRGGIRDRGEGGLTDEDIQKSPLRFTWEYKNPKYYFDQKGHRTDTAIVVISKDADEVLPGQIKQITGGYQVSKVFNTYEGIFSFRTGVRVYQRALP